MINLYFVDLKMLSFQTKDPTEEELTSLKVKWLSPLMSGYGEHLVRRDRVVEQQEPTEEDIFGITISDWRERLGNFPEEVMRKTIEGKTQYCSGPLEMDNLDYPFQHRQKRILPLHPRRIKGRVDSDMYYSIVQSIDGFTCVQLFVCIDSQFIFIKCMKKESIPHSSLQDFVCTIGAPNTLLTDNALTIGGERWRKTNRTNVTRHIFIVPHNQQQNQSERKIGYIKRMERMTLRMSKAPLVFWSYCCRFMVDCWNHIAHQMLQWKTPKEVLDGNTPDISMFRFACWKEIEYVENTEKFPERRFQDGCLIRISWGHGDAMSYYVWSEPDGDWKKGGVLVQNVVQSREGGVKGT